LVAPCESFDEEPKELFVCGIIGIASQTPVINRAFLPIKPERHASTWKGKKVYRTAHGLTSK
jgi:hypothetical protein